MDNNENSGVFFDKDKLIKHAKIVLKSKKFTGVELAKEVGIHVQQIYGYKSGRRNIKDAQLETLSKFERLYQQHAAFEKSRKGEQ